MTIWNYPPKSYKGFWNSLSLYWENYGGTVSLFRSPYFHLAVALSLVAFPFWTREHDPTWYDISISALPNLLGFTLGGYAILLAFGDERFMHILSGKEDDGSPSPFMRLNSTFVHFILIQVVAILTAILGSAWDLKSGLFALFGFFCFAYSILSAAAAALAVLRVACWFDVWKTKNKTGRQDGD